MKTMRLKIPFEIILRNKKTREEIKVGDISVPVKVNIDKKVLHQIMKMNVEKEVDDGNSNGDTAGKNDVRTENI